VLLHELGHALISIDEGVPVKSITLFIFGGVAHIAREPDTPRAEFRIVAAGPFTSLVLSGIFTVLGGIPFLPPALRGAVFYLAEINLILALFNLIPGFPLDGGRLLRSLLWKWKDDFLWATRWATNMGFTIAFLFVVAGVGLIATGHWFNGIWVAFIGWYLGLVARDSYKQSVLSKLETPFLTQEDWWQDIQGQGVSIHQKTSPNELSPVYIFPEVSTTFREGKLIQSESIDQTEESDTFP
jgi:Zn-dependent protease